MITVTYGYPTPDFDPEATNALGEALATASRLADIVLAQAMQSVETGAYGRAAAAARHITEATRELEVTVRLLGGNTAFGGSEILTTDGETIQVPTTTERLRQPAGDILNPEFYDVNILTAENLRRAGIIQIRDFYLLGQDDLIRQRVLSFNDGYRLARDLATWFPELPPLPERKFNPDVAAQLYDSLDEMPANTVFGDFIRKNFGKSAQLTMRQLSDALNRENYTFEGFQTNGLGGGIGLRTRNEIDDFIEKFEEAKRQQEQQ